MLRIKVSYEYPEELSSVVKALAPLGITTKTAEQNGRYKRAYIRVKSGKMENKMPTGTREF